MAQARGHNIVYAAPGFSELQSIELIWANVKGTVGRAYTSDTTFQDVYKRLDNAFYHLDSATIKATIDNSTAKLIALEKALRQAEEAAAMVSIASGLSDGDSDTSSSCDESSAGSSDGGYSDASDVEDHPY
ncbi:hypothetical protein DYB31_015208 [Aphanomyces astaci]|nr:hypothetical protein DYB31_015208 [Aphanomyces astaci]